MNDTEKKSFFNRVKDILSKYNLPGIELLSEMNVNKTQWKIETKKTIRQYWTERLKDEASDKSTLKYCAINDLRIGQTHRVWKTLNSYRQEVIKGTVKSRILTGTYILQSTRAKFNQFEVDATCPLCRLESETITHMLLRCPALYDVRKEPLHQLQQLVIRYTSADFWNTKCRDKEFLTHLIIDCNYALKKSVYETNEDFLDAVETLSRTLCFALHIERLKRTSGGQK